MTTLAGLFGIYVVAIIVGRWTVRPGRVTFALLAFLALIQVAVTLVVMFTMEAPKLMEKVR